MLRQGGGEVVLTVRAQGVVIVIRVIGVQRRVDGGQARVGDGRGGQARVPGIKAAIKENTKAIEIETLGNPNSEVVDIEKIANIAHERCV